MPQHFVINLLAYLVPTFAPGFVWHLKVFDAYYRQLGIYRTDVIIPFGFLSMLIQGTVFAFVYPRVMAHPGSMADGLCFAAGAALFSWSFTTLAVAAKHPMTSVRRFVAIETAFTVVQCALVGPLLAVSS
ncbi:MAG: hypothetical protein ABI625_06990 [bacterium]